jgi:hypothetical protein
MIKTADAAVIILLNIVCIDLITPGAWQRPPSKRLVAIFFVLFWRKPGMLATIIYGHIQKPLLSVSHSAGISWIVLDMP